MTQPRLPPRPVAPPPMPQRARVHVTPVEPLEPPPTTLVHVVQALANEALERSVRDAKMLHCAERIANGMDRLIALQHGPVPTVRGWTPALSWYRW